MKEPKGKALQNLFLLSKEKFSYLIAIKEWTFSGEVIEYDEPVYICTLCNNNNLIRHFKIYNEIGNEMLVGSECIKKFEIPVFNENSERIEKDVVNYLNTYSQRIYILKIFEELISKNNLSEMRGNIRHDLDKSCKDIFQRYDILNARIVNYLFVRFKEENIKFKPKKFKISIKSKDDQFYLLSLNEVQFNRINKALTKPQIKFYKENK